MSTGMTERAIGDVPSRPNVDRQRVRGVGLHATGVHESAIQLRIRSIGWETKTRHTGGQRLFHNLVTFAGPTAGSVPVVKLCAQPPRLLIDGSAPHPTEFATTVHALRPQGHRPTNRPEMVCD